MTRLHEFDALRGVAAVSVVFAHLLNYRPAAIPDPLKHESAPLWSFAANGHFAVLIFFAISGFVLSYPYFSGAKTDRNLLIDVANRLPRLMIPVFLTGLLCLALQHLAASGGENLAIFGDPDWIARWNVEGWGIGRSVEFLVTHVFFLYSETDTMNVNLWTMPIEFAFSFIVFAIAALVLRRLDLFVFLLLIAAACLVSWRADATEYLLKGIAGSAFGLGVFVAFRLEAIRGMVNKVPGLAYVMIVVGLLLSSALERDGLHYLVANGLAMISIALLFIGFTCAEKLRAALIRPSLSILGELSFALYLVHGAVLYLVFLTIARWTDTYGMAEYAAGVIVSLILSFGIAFVVARYVEMPLVSRVRRFIGNGFRDAKTA